MTVKAIAVIGLNFGDEGKGLVTDSLVNFNTSGTVIRFNGGAQAGHTVVTPEGVRHVFSHIGSGALSGADTYLSRFFICNPSSFNKEICEVRKKTTADTGTIFVHKEAILTTPWDEILNQFLEHGRGEERHGSVGVGIGETVARSAHKGVTLRVRDLHSVSHLSEILLRIGKVYFPERIRTLMGQGEFSKLTPQHKENLSFLMGNSNEIASEFVGQAFKFLSEIEVVDKGVFKNPLFPVIFEGAQGLLLDQEKGTLPHVTPSYTGLRNVVDICREEGIELQESVFVTRPYLTRHGAGPLENEGKWLGKVVDTTNTPNLYQGSIRTAPLDWSGVFGRIVDESRIVSDEVKRSIAVTHCDTLSFPYEMEYTKENFSIAVEEVDFEHEILQGLDNAYFGYGPTRKNFVKL